MGGVWESWVGKLVGQLGISIWGIFAYIGC